MKIIIQAGDKCEHGVPWQRHGNLTMILDCARCALECWIGRAPGWDEPPDEPSHPAMVTSYDERD